LRLMRSLAASAWRTRRAKIANHKKVVAWPC